MSIEPISTTSEFEHYAWSHCFDGEGCGNGFVKCIDFCSVERFAWFAVIVDGDYENCTVSLEKANELARWMRLLGWKIKLIVATVNYEEME